MADEPIIIQAVPPDGLSPTATRILMARQREVDRIIREAHNQVLAEMRRISDDAESIKNDALSVAHALASNAVVGVVFVLLESMPVLPPSQAFEITLKDVNGRIQKGFVAELERRLKEESGKK
jgi:predicted RNA polymerase sigma factor